MNTGLFENVAEDWLDEKYPAWLANPENNPRFWQVAWDGEQLAGMVLARIDEVEGDQQRDTTAWRCMCQNDLVAVEGFDYQEFAEYLFAHDIQALREDYACC